MASGVPKFTSFRPKPNSTANHEKRPPKPDLEARDGKSPPVGTPESSTLPKKSSQDRSPERLRRSEKRARERPQETNIARQEGSSRAGATPYAPPSKVFFSDRRGDLDILRYGLDRRDVPEYRRVGYGNVVGLTLDKKIDRDLSTEKAIVLTSSTRRGKERLLTRKNAVRELTRAARFVRRPSERVSDDHHLDFIAFSTSHKRKRSESLANDVEDDHDVDYGGIQNARTGSNLPEDVDAKYDSDTVVDAVTADLTARNSTLIRATKERPEDLRAWIDLVEFQETMMKMERPTAELRPTDKQHLAEVRISIYEQALQKANSNESDQVSLYCGLMTEASRAWSQDSLARKWTEILTTFPFSEELWLKYMDFLESSFVSFRFETCKSAFEKCLETMQLSSNAVDTDFSLYIFTRLTSMIHHAGYQELALAAWQALLEYQLLAPVHATQSTDEALRAFEEFWESEVPRIGENIAKGWRHSTLDEGPCLHTDSVSLSQSDPIDDIWNGFRKREVDHIAKLRFPGRTTDELGGDDPFHTVLFSDIESFLKLLPRNCEHTAVLSAFLQFCDLPPLRRSGLYIGRYVFDPFLRTEIYGVSQGSTSSFTKLLEKYQNCPIKKFQTTTWLLFYQSFPEETKITDLAFVRRALKLLVGEIHDGEMIGEYLLALDSRYFPSEALKTARQLLKTHPTSLRLYNAYGLVELRRSNFEKADQVFSAALSMQKGESILSTSDSLELYYNWVWGALHHCNSNDTLWRFASPTGVVAKPSGHADGPDQATLLRTQRTLDDTCQRALLSSDFSKATLVTSLAAILAYLVGKEEPEIALVVFSKLSTWFASHGMTQSPGAELHAQYVAQLLAYHAEHAPIVKPALLRNTLEPYLATFPDNTILLSLYAANEARFAIDDRVRSMMHRNAIEQNRNIVSWFFAIHYEIMRGEIAGTTAHSIRALFQKAEDDVGAHCAALWKHHVLFEIAEARKERQKRPQKRPRKDGKKSKEIMRIEVADRRVRDMFFRGLAHLPWCKNYMMMAFTQLGEEFLDQEDLRKVYNVMVEKELRLYIEVEETGG